MMGQGADERSLKTPKAVGAATMGVFVYLDDADKHYEVAKSGGRGNRPPAEGRVLRPYLLGERSRGSSMVLHEPAEVG